MGILSRLFGRSEPSPSSQQPAPPRTTEDRGRERHEDIQTMLREQAASSPRQAREIAAGSVDGVHYLELVEPIKQAKREGRNEDALKLCYQAVEGAENDRPVPGEHFSDPTAYERLKAAGIVTQEDEESQQRDWVPAPAYTQHAAIVLRKLGRREEELAVLERYLQHVRPDRRDAHEFAERAAKVRELIDAGK
ncbi:MAG: hypothetical protein L0G94_10175 [Brachybacterium sp.]|uniref:hypothetical protein n=1 Tax=Brachybacterium sp. TaxID=1891286 RepID=UPI002648AA07|nr:hypothetical protein [Brachybacterium sp.]MDN5687020.1 hypothetical protein [Brachybacterium sp.]